MRAGQGGGGKLGAPRGGVKIGAWSWGEPSRRGGSTACLFLHLPERRAPDSRKALIQPVNKHIQVTRSGPGPGRAEQSMRSLDTVQSRLRETWEAAWPALQSSHCLPVSCWSPAKQSKKLVLQSYIRLLFFPQVRDPRLSLAQPRDSTAPS